MASTVEVLKKNGIVNPDQVIELAAKAGLELAVAAVMLEKETGGGRNIYGHDSSAKTGGVYKKGGPVTPENYKLYKANRKKNGTNGVGPTQLTFVPFQDLADARGGCFDWRTNVSVGFEVLAGHVTAHGVREGFKRYNGSTAYANDAMDRLARWRDRLDDAPRTLMAARPDLEEGATGSTVTKLQKFLNRTFPLYSSIDLGVGKYDRTTSNVLKEFQRRAGVSGTDVDPKGRFVKAPTWRALERFGFR